MRVRLQGSGSAFDNLSDELGDMMDELMSGSSFRLVSSDAWEPHLNIYEVSDRFMVCAELAGMRHEDIDVYTEAGALHISGERPKPTLPDCEEDPSVHIMEIDSGRFHRKIAIPPDVDESAMSASYRNGLLWILLPRRPA